MKQVIIAIAAIALGQGAMGQVEELEEQLANRLVKAAALECVVRVGEADTIEDQSIMLRGCVMLCEKFEPEPEAICKATLRDYTNAPIAARLGVDLS